MRTHSTPARLLLATFVALLLSAVMGASLARAQDGTDASAGAGGAPSASAIDAYLVSVGSPMAGQGAAFMASGGRWQVDPRLLVAIAGAESSFGQYTCAPFNGWGWGCPNGPYEFTSWADGIDAVAQGLRTNYLADGLTTVAAIQQRYAPSNAANDPTGLNNHWTGNVSRFLVELGGDPNDVDLDGIAGTIPLGPLGGAGGADAFGVADDLPGVAGNESTPALVVRAGTPRPLIVRVHNTGSVAWHADDIRLRRVDGESRIAGAPYGALASDRAVEPGAVARFVVQLAAVGSHDGEALTQWRLEGPSGQFGDVIERTVRFEVPTFVAADPTVEATPTNAGIAGGGAWTVVVNVRNAGSDTWERDGEAPVLLGLGASVGGALDAQGWLTDRIAARMLERTAAPGEFASFAFRVRTADAGIALALRPTRAGAWADGPPAIVELGTVAPAQLDSLRP